MLFFFPSIFLQFSLFGPNFEVCWIWKGRSVPETGAISVFRRPEWIAVGFAQTGWCRIAGVGEWLPSPGLKVDMTQSLARELKDVLHGVLVSLVILMFHLSQRSLPSQASVPGSLVHCPAGSFRSGQLEVVQALLAGQWNWLLILAESQQVNLHIFFVAQLKVAGEDVLYVFPTGAGKSLCYQLPSLLSKGKSLG